MTLQLPIIKPKIEFLVIYLLNCSLVFDYNANYMG